MRAALLWGLYRRIRKLNHLFFNDFDEFLWTNNFSSEKS